MRIQFQPVNLYYKGKHSGSSTEASHDGGESCPRPPCRLVWGGAHPNTYTDHFPSMHATRGRGTDMLFVGCGVNLCCVSRARLQYVSRFNT